jgi:hypothetical protein
MFERRYLVRIKLIPDEACDHAMSPPFSALNLAGGWIAMFRALPKHVRVHSGKLRLFKDWSLL